MNLWKVEHSHPWRGLISSTLLLLLQCKLALQLYLPLSLHYLAKVTDIFLYQSIRCLEIYYLPWSSCHGYLCPHFQPSSPPSPTLKVTASYGTIACLTSYKYLTIMISITLTIVLILKQWIWIIPTNHILY